MAVDQVQSLGYYGTSIRYELNVSDEIADLSGARLLAYVWNNFRELWPGKYYSTRGYYINGKYHYRWRRSRVIKDGDACPLTGVCFDCAITDAVNALWRGPVRKNYTYANLVEDVISAIEHDWAADYEDHFSMEYFADFAEANDLIFTADGRECYSASEANRA